MAMIQSYVDKGDVSYSDRRLLISLYDIEYWASEFSSPTRAFNPSFSAIQRVIIDPGLSQARGRYSFGFTQGKRK
jgi:hypothetical protein